jgi:hypothetical protein
MRRAEREQSRDYFLAFQNLSTKYGRKWVAAFMNEDTPVIALHGSLTAAEQLLATSPVGGRRGSRLSPVGLSKWACAFSRPTASGCPPNGLRVAETARLFGPSIAWRDCRP